MIRAVTAPAAGYVRRLGAIRVGNAALHLGAGRRTKEDAVDHAVGVVCHAKRGDRVEAGEPAGRDSCALGSDGRPRPQPRCSPRTSSARIRPRTASVLLEVVG